MVKNDQVHIPFAKIFPLLASFPTFISRTDRIGSDRFGTVKSRNGQVEFLIVEIHLVTIITTAITYFCPIFVPTNLRSDWLM